MGNIQYSRRVSKQNQAEKEKTHKKVVSSSNSHGLRVLYYHKKHESFFIEFIDRRGKGH
jgi:hypothetical protein